MVAERTHQIEVALELVERSDEDTLEALGTAIDLRDAATEGHSRRVYRFALEIATVMGLSESQQKTLAMGAYLHDIGKLALPDGILLKPGPLTNEERVFMQRNVQIAWNQHEISSLPSWQRSGGAVVSLALAELITFVCCQHHRRPVPRSRRQLDRSYFFPLRGF